MYTRAMNSDYDDWETVHGNTGWGHKDLNPLMQKTETYQVGNDKPTHGYGGPLKVSYGGAYTNVGKQFLDIAMAYDKERGLTDDVNGMTESTSVNKYGVRDLFSSSSVKEGRTHVTQYSVGRSEMFPTSE